MPPIVHGKVTNITYWPWHATIFKRRNVFSDFHYICGGTIIRNGVILTAAHCITKTGTSIVEDLDLLTVIVGTLSSNYTQNNPTLGSQELQVNIKKKKKK